ncbi:WG repeat-containing protein [Robiginitalea marina]|uniref:WG repeat-containing protein n=1 Tax=Robiginitalea marina TaxID=2954105 RepID=A0ABT1AZN3_9FLAO|nr:WG repeat-containing protein [Robiginitalea marina]MCO5725159.1 WG repeat-containing protein [Robiginitalea marina]
MKRLVLFLVILLPGLLWNAQAQSLKTLNKPLLEGLDQVAPFHEGLAAVRKADQWGFINTDGELVIDFRDDLVWNASPDPEALGVRAVAYPHFQDGRCMIRALGEEEIPVYGFIDTEGRTAIEPEYLNLTEFQNGNAIGVHVKKTFRGTNNFQLNIYDYSFTEVVLNPQGEAVWPLGEVQDILMKKRRYSLPPVRAKLLGNQLVAVETTPGKWEVRKIQY